MNNIFNDQTNTDLKNEKMEASNIVEAKVVEEEAQPITLSTPIERLLDKYINYLNAPKGGYTPIRVDEIASKIAKFYELIRKVVDWKDDNVLRRSATERILKRLLFSNLSGISNVSHADSYKLAETVTLDLIRGGHLPNNEIPQEYIETVSTAIKKYLIFLENIKFGADPISIKKRINFSTFLIEIAACEIEDILSKPVLEENILITMTETTEQHIKVKPADSMTQDEIRIQTYIATCRTLFDLDEAFITYHLLLFQYPKWNLSEDELVKRMTADMVTIWEQSETILSHPLSKQFNLICERYDTIFALVGDVINELKKDPDEILPVFHDWTKLKKLLEKHYDKRYTTLKKRLFLLAVFSTLSVFLSNWVTYFLVEVPLASLFAEGFSLFTTFIDFIVPTAVSFALVSIIKPPPKSNKDRVLNVVYSFIKSGSEIEYSEIVAKAPRRPIIRFVMGTIYTTITVSMFYLVAWVFWKANLPITSVIFDTFTIALTFFAAVGIRNKSKELSVDDRSGAMEFLLDMVSVPIARVGSVLAAKWKEYNIIAFLFTFLIETPFVIIVDLIEQWSKFIKERRAEIH